MSLFEKIKSGQITKPAILSSLAKSEAEKIELARNRTAYGPELYAQKQRELDFSIGLLKLVVNKFIDLAPQHLTEGETDEYTDL